MSLGSSSTSSIRPSPFTSVPSWFWHREIERGPFVHDAFSPYPAAVTGDDALHGRESDPGALEIFGQVQALEHTKELVRVLHVEADAVVSDEHDHVLASAISAPDLDLGMRASAGKLDRVGNKIVERELEHRAVAVHAGQRRPDLPRDVAAVGFPLEVAQHLAQHLSEADQRHARLDPTDARERQEVVDQRAHLLSRIHKIGHVAPASLVE